MIRRAFNAVDAKVLELHQRAVDLSGRSPAWCAEQGALFTGVAAIAAQCLRPTQDLMSWVFCACTLALSGAAVCLARSGLLAWVSSGSTRRFCLILFLLTGAIDVLLFAAGHHKGAHQWVGDIGFTGWIALNYFATCRPPKPRPPKRSAAVLQGGAA